MSDQIKSSWQWAPLPIGAIKDSGLSDGAKVLFANLFSYGSPQNTTVFPSIERLAEDLSKSASSIRRAMRELKDSGWVVVEERPGSSNIYHLKMTPVKNDTPVKNEGGPLPKMTPITIQLNDTKEEGADAPPPEDAIESEDTQEAPPKKTRKRDKAWDYIAFILYGIDPEHQEVMSEDTRVNTGRTTGRIRKISKKEGYTEEELPDLIQTWLKWWRNVPTQFNWQCNPKKRTPNPKDIYNSWSQFLRYHKDMQEYEAYKARQQDQFVPYADVKDSYGEQANLPKKEIPPIPADPCQAMRDILGSMHVVGAEDA